MKYSLDDGMERAMHRLANRYLDWIECEDACSVEFPGALPGFPTEREFVFIRNEAHAPLVFMQSLSTSELCFLAVPVAEVETGYELELSEKDAAVLGVEGPAREDLEVLVLISQQEGEPATANLMAPIVVHTSRRRAVQAVRGDQRYSARHVLGEREPTMPVWQRDMRIIRRRDGESILLGEEVEVEILECGQGQVKVGIRAPREIVVLRKEIREAQEENRTAQWIGKEALPELIRVLGRVPKPKPKYEIRDQNGYAQIVEADSLEKALERAKEWAAPKNIYPYPIIVAVWAYELDEDGARTGRYLFGEVAAGPEPTPSVPAKRFTMHRLEDGGRGINAAVLASSETEEEAQKIAAELGSTWYEGVAIWDHLAGVIDFGGVFEKKIVNAMTNSVSAERFTIHPIAPQDRVIKAAILASAKTEAQAKAIAEKLDLGWRYGVAIWDHDAGLVNFGGEEDLDPECFRVFPVSSVRIEP